MAQRIVNIHEAKTHLSKLIQRVLLGEEITIGKADKPVARLVPVRAKARPRKPGSARGQITISRDFDKPVPESDLPGFH